MRKLYHKFLCACALSIGLCASAYAQTPGTACRSAIPMGQNYSAQVQNGQTIWYSAWTFDLPLTVTFAPTNGANDPAPLVEMDFTCTPGYYRDTILCSLFCATSGSGISIDLPHKPKLDSKVINGKFVYYLSLGKTYRDLLLQMGISYNVEVFVKVTYRSGGTISLAPDEMFTSCVDNAKFMHFGDTVQVKAFDTLRHVVVPYVQWQYDSIQYEWTGTQPCHLAVGNSCSFHPLDGTDASIIDGGAIQPGGKWKVTSDLLTSYVTDQVNFPNEAGLYFAKFYSTEPGVIKINKVPAVPPRGKAILLRYKRTYPLVAYDTVIYAMPKTWNEDLEFITPTKHVFRMIISNDPDFAVAHVLDTCWFDPTENGHHLGLFSKTLKAYWQRAIDQYLYVRFVCSEATTVTPYQWEMSECISKSPLIEKGKDIDVKKGSYGEAYYRFYYNHWRGGDMKFRWKGTQGKCPLYIGDTCKMKITSSTDPHIVLRANVPKNSTWTLTADNLESLAPHVDPDGYLYIRFDPGGNAKMVVTSTAPAEKDPEYPHTTVDAACQEGTINVYLVRVTEPQTLTLYDSADQPVQTWAAVADQAQLVGPLASGTYHIVGTSETIEIVVP